MGVPKKKRSKSRKKSRQSRKLSSSFLGACPQCGAPALSHFACPECGYYKGKQVVIVKAKEERTKEKG